MDSKTKNSSKEFLVSVAMATYNGEQFLRKQLESIFNQTYKNIELIVTDDHSTDSTVRILEDYKGRAGYQFHVNEKRLGFKKNFERALSFCKGEYIAFSDHDDIWLPEKIELLVKGIGDYSLVCSDLAAIDINDNVIVPSMVKNNSLPMSRPDLYRMVLNFKLIAIGCASLFKRELLRVAFPIPDYAEGHDWWVAMVAVREKGIKYVDKVLTLYRRHDINISEFSNNLNELVRILRYLSPKWMKRWYETRAKLKDILERSLLTRLALEENEKVIIKESIYYLDCFIKSKFDARFFKYGFRHRFYLFSKKHYYWLECMTYLSNIVKKSLAKVLRNFL